MCIARSISKLYDVNLCMFCTYVLVTNRFCMSKVRKNAIRRRKTKNIGLSRVKFVF